VTEITIRDSGVGEEVSECSTVAGFSVTGVVVHESDDEKETP